jgi:hypothetical protein
MAAAAFDSVGVCFLISFFQSMKCRPQGWADIVVVSDSVEKSTRDRQISAGGILGHK